MPSSSDNSLGVLLKAIIAKHIATSAITAAMKGPWQHSKPSRFASEENYVIIKPGISVDQGWTCKRRYWLHEPEFRFYAKTPDLADLNANLWLATFGREDLTLTLDVGAMFMHRVVRVGTAELEPQSVDFASVTMRFRTWGNRIPLPT